MGRHKAYDREKVLNDAMQLFWQKGYHGTPLSELVAVTGLNKHSMYKEFGSKAGIFEECIEHYWMKALGEPLSLLRQKPLGLSNIIAFFEDRIEYICSKEFKSCLFVKATIEHDLVEDRALEHIQKKNRVYTGAFADCLKAAADSGEIPETSDPEFLTDYLFHFLVGMLVMGKPKKGKAEAKKQLDFIISSLKAG